MSAGEFAEGEGDGPTDKCGEDEAEDDGGSGKLDRGSRAEEQAGADGSTDRDHGHLAGS